MSMSDDRPVLDQVNLVSADLAASVEFYRMLGVEIPSAGPFDDHHRTAVVPAAAGIDFDLDSTAFAGHWGSADVPVGALLGFRVTARDTVDALYERMTGAGHRGLRAPYDAFWGARYAILEDSGGVAVGLMSEPSDAHRGPPPDPAGLGTKDSD